MPSEPFVYVPIPSSTYSEFILRSGKHVDVGAFIANIVDDYLIRTHGDSDIWSKEHAEEAAEEETINGSPFKGYQWQTVFLPNGTQVRMLYSAQNHYAVIRHEKLTYEDKSLSPSEFASRVADNTNRNAWRDLYVLLPGETEWEQADVLRKRRAGGR